MARLTRDSFSNSKLNFVSANEAESMTAPWGGGDSAPAMPAPWRERCRPSAPSRLSGVMDRAADVRLRHEDRVVILSDLHVGDGGKRDDFVHNSELVMETLRRRYLRQGYRLVLNGDVEELQNFSLTSIVRAWPQLYELLNNFRELGPNHLLKVLGNHDEILHFKRRFFPLRDLPLLEGVKLQWNNESLFVFHGHQASHFQTFLGRPAGYLVRYIFSPIGFRNGASKKEAKRIRMERRIYDFAREQRVIAVIGHTHRPLFESLSKYDTLQFRIEQLCRDHARATPRERERLSSEIRKLSTELREHAAEIPKSIPPRGGLYDDHCLVPCLFNSGCATGKRGFTALEIADGRIKLVHWFDRRISDKHFEGHEAPPEQLDDTDFFRVTLKEDTLNYIFTRIGLLT